MAFARERSLPDGFMVGHTIAYSACAAAGTREAAATGCTVVICPPGTRGGVDVRGGGAGTRELEPLAVLANAEGPSAVLLTGGSAFGLAAADGVMRWLEQRSVGRATPIGVVPLVPTAVVFDLSAGDPGARPGPPDGEAACDAAAGGIPDRGRVGAGTGAAVGKILGRDRATPSGVGYAAVTLADGVTVAVIAVANASQSRSHAQAKHIPLPVAPELAVLFDRDACFSRAYPFPSGALGMVCELAGSGAPENPAEPAHYLFYAARLADPLTAVVPRQEASTADLMRCANAGASLMAALAAKPTMSLPKPWPSKVLRIVTFV